MYYTYMNIGFLLFGFFIHSLYVSILWNYKTIEGALKGLIHLTGCLPYLCRKQFLLDFNTCSIFLHLKIPTLHTFCHQVIAESLSEEEIAGLKEMFQAMDTDNSGAITFDELKAGLRRYGSTLKDTEIRDLMDAVRQLLQSLLGVFFCRKF
ncbi:hypothetical protein CsSME_00025743 [Camellia sinensis var. sinensis]